MASWYGMENIVFMLLDRGADINAHGRGDKFALHTALASKHENIARLLIKKGAYVNFRVSHILKNEAWLTLYIG
jgi:ankyrin repeat protein